MVVGQVVIHAEHVVYLNFERPPQFFQPVLATNEQNSLKRGKVLTVYEISYM